MTQEKIKISGKLISIGIDMKYRPLVEQKEATIELSPEELAEQFTATEIEDLFEVLLYKRLSKKQPQQEFCSCSGTRIIRYMPNGNEICNTCHKPIQPPPEVKKEIEELKFWHNDTQQEIVDKLNEVIRHINRKD